MKEKIYRTFIELTNSLPVSKGIMKYTRSNLSKPVISSYAKVFNVNLDEMEGKLKDYSSLHHFFTRNLKNGVRPIVKNEKAIVSPVDAKIEKYGDINDTNQFLVKNKSYSIEELLGSEELVKRYQGGKFIVLYLSPSHYHRIHSPIDGEIINQYEIGNTSYPVNSWGLKYGRSPLSKNYRTVTELKGNNNNFVAVVKVGAMFINTIELTHKTNKLLKGNELAYFSFGSTVVLFFEEGKVDFSGSLIEQQEIKVGETLAIKNI